MEQRNEYIKTTKNKLNILKQDLEDFEKKAAKYSGDAKKEAEEKILKLKNNVSKLTEQINTTIKSATESNWDEVKNQYSESMDEIKDAIKSGREWLSKIIAP